jgi:hypothetical protein
MQRNKSLRLRPRCSTAYSGEAAKLGRQVSTGLARLAARWCCTGVVGISGSARCGRLGAEGMWWAWWLVLLLLLLDGRWKRQSRGQRSTGFVPGRCSGTRSQFPSVGTGLRCGSQSPWMAMVLLPLSSWPTARPCFGGGGVHGGWLKVEDEQGSRGLGAISVFFRVLCSIWWDSCPGCICGGSRTVCTRICTLYAGI